MKLRFNIYLLSLLIASQSAYADIRAKSYDEISSVRTSAGETIVELSNRGRHFEAIIQHLQTEEYEESIADRLAAARSAWALGDIAKAREIWDRLFAHPDFDGQNKDEAGLARAIMELQESQFETARAVAEVAADALESSDLRAQFWLVIAESLKEQGIYSQAEKYYKKAVEEGNEETQAEGYYLLGACQLKLGMLDEARYSFSGITTTSQYAPKALRKLIEIDFIQKDYEAVLTWLSEGKQTYATDFSDAWAAYVYVAALSEVGRVADAEKALRAFGAKHSPKNAWFMLAEAVFEAKYFEAAQTRAQLSPVAAAKGKGQR